MSGIRRTILQVPLSIANLLMLSDILSVVANLKQLMEAPLHAEAVKRLVETIAKEEASRPTYTLLGCLLCRLSPDQSRLIQVGRIMQPSSYRPQVR